jgi:hypothetical protein
MKRLLAVSGLLLATAAGVTAPTVSASAATSQASGQYCVVKVTPVTAAQMAASKGRAFSRVLSHACSNDPAKVGFIMSPDSAAVSPDAQVVIWTGYQYTDYKGAQVQFKGPDACSANIGYPIRDSRPVDNGAGNWGISSWHAWASCWYTEIFTEQDFLGSEYIYKQGMFEAAQIGAPFDDHVWSVYTGY